MNLMFLRILHRLLRKRKISNGCKRTRQVELRAIIGIRTRANPNHDVTHMYVIRDSPSGTDADDGLHIIEWYSSYE